jgi:hypothetical protein
VVGVRFPISLTIYRPIEAAGGMDRTLRIGARMSPEEQIPIEDIAMQVFCTNCGREQYPPLVNAISHGEEPCLYCDVTPPVLTTAEYRALLRERAGHFAVKRTATTPRPQPTETSAQL